MSWYRVKWLAGMAALLGIVALGTQQAAHAQEKYPAKPIELIIAFVAGGPTDIWGRALAEEMGKLLKVPMPPSTREGQAERWGPRPS